MKDINGTRTLLDRNPTEMSRLNSVRQTVQKPRFACRKLTQSGKALLRRALKIKQSFFSRKFGHAMEIAIVVQDAAVTLFFGYRPRSLGCS